MSLKGIIKNTVNRVLCSIRNLQRPPGKVSRQALEERGELLSDIVIRDAAAADIPKLAALHVKAWAETHGAKRAPVFDMRERQWTGIFDNNDGSWFCLVLENKTRELVGFAFGKRYDHSDLPAFSGEVNKIYLLRNYQRMGLGRKLICAVSRRFLKAGVSSMVLFGDAANPSGYFHLAMGAEKLYAANGEFHGGFGWYDLTKLAALCASAEE